MPISSFFNQSNYFSSYIDIKAISAPSNPHSGVGRLYHNVSDGKLYFKTSDGTTIELGGGSGTLTSVSNVGTGDGDVYRDTVSGVINLKTIKAGTNITVTNNANDITIAASGGAGGETNTASNQGTAGVGVFIQKTDADLEFKNINAASPKVTVADDPTNNEIDIDIDESALDLANIGGELPDASLSGNVPLLNAANVFSAVQKINVDNGQQMTFYRPVNDVGFGAGFYYDFNTDTDTEATYGFNYVGVEDNTDGAHRGDFYIQLAIAGSLGIRFRNYTSGNGGIIIGNNQRVIIDETGQTSAHTFTFPDSTQTLVGRTDTATLTNKTLTTPTIASIINSGTLTLPTSTDTLVGRATTDTLTNKTIDAIGTGNLFKNIGPFKYEIFKDGSTYYCRNTATGAIEVSNSSPNTVLGYPFTVGGSAFVRDGDYTLTGTPSVYFDFPDELDYVQFVMSPEANIIVPNGYTGTVFRFKTGTNHCTEHILRGGFIDEAGTEVKAWIGVLFEGSGSGGRGVFANVVSDMRIWNADVGIKFNCDATATSAFVNDNWLSNIMLYRCKTAFIDFGMDTTYIAGTNGSNRNVIMNTLIQGGDSLATVTGIRNIRGRNNTFMNVYVADFSGSNGPRSTIHADSTDTLIIGGTMDTAVGATAWVDASTDKSTTRVTETAGITGKKVTTPSFEMWDSAKDHKYIFATGDLAADRTITYPVLTGNDVPVYQAHTQTLTNKTLTSPTITNAGNAITLPSSAQTLVGRTTVDTMTNKTITGPVFDSHVEYNEISTPTTPAANKIRLFMDSTDEIFKLLTSFGVVVPNGPISGNTEGMRWGRYDGVAGSGGNGVFAGAVTNTGGLNAAVDTTHGVNYRLNTGGTNGNGCSLRIVSTYTARIFNPYLAVKFSVDTATNNRIAVGFKSNSLTQITDDTDDPLVSASGIMLCQRASASTNSFEIATNNGGTTSYTSTGVTVAANTVYNFRVRGVGDTKFQWSINGSAWADITTTIPASTTALGVYAGIQTDETGIHQLRIFTIETTSDK